MSIHRPVRDRLAAAAPALRWSVRQRAPVRRTAALDTRCEIVWLNRHGGIEEFSRMVPGIAYFRAAFTALARGGLVTTNTGPVAVEDLMPGDVVLTCQGPKQLRWKGSTICRSIQGRRLYRLPADALGIGRPEPDLLLGPAARIVGRGAGRTNLPRNAPALVPVARFADGLNVIEIAPLSAVQTFHLGFDAHATFAVNGVEIESYHPGTVDPALDEETAGLFLGLFPHVHRMKGFGPLALPRSDEPGREGPVDLA